jgi:hypothetical protein
MKRNWATLVFSATMLIFAFQGCSKKPSEREYFRKMMDTRVVYLYSNAPAAEAALLELEAFARKCQDARIWRVKFEKEFVFIYARLYLLNKHAGKESEAEAYFNKFYENYTGSVAEFVGE